jgi:hypothetical protein
MEFAHVVRPAFDRDFLARATHDEREVLQEHGEWLEARYADGRVVFAGRCGIARHHRGLVRASQAHHRPEVARNG